MTPQELNDLQQRYPFLSVVEYLNQEYLGIVQQADQQFISIYAWDDNWTDMRKKRFLVCGETWWWESNRKIPINIFLKDEWQPFKPYLKTFNNKSLTIIHGPTTSISELTKRRIKRRSITLVKRM